MFERPNGKHHLTPDQAVFELARRGRTEVLPKLAVILEANPALTQRCGDLAAMAESTIIAMIVGENLMQAAALREKLGSLRREWGGPSPSALVKQLVDRMAVCWLEANYADFQAAFNRASDGPRTLKARIKQQESAHRRFLAAMRTLAQVRKFEGGAVPKAAPERPDAAKVEWPAADTPPTAVPGSDPPEESTPLTRREAAARDEEILLASAPI